MKTLAWTTQLPSPSRSGRRSEILMTPSRSQAPWLPLPTGSSRASISGRFLVDSYLRFRQLGGSIEFGVGHQSTVPVDCMVHAPSPTVPQGACTGAEEPQPEPHGGPTVDSVSLGSERSVAESVAVGPDGSTGPCPLARGRRPPAAVSAADSACPWVSALARSD